MRPGLCGLVPRTKLLCSPSLALPVPSAAATSLCSLVSMHGFIKTREAAPALCMFFAHVLCWDLGFM